TIDNDLPTGVAAGPAYGQPGQIITLGGTVSDPTPYISDVQVSVGNGAWQEAPFAQPVNNFGATQGLAYDWKATNHDGSHTFRVRGVDAVGHVGNPSAPTTIIVDGVLPGATSLNTGNPVFRAAAGDNGSFLVPLQGNATDDRSGVDYVEVLM